MLGLLVGAWNSGKNLPPPPFRPLMGSDQHVLLVCSLCYISYILQRMCIEHYCTTTNLPFAPAGA